jgi:hypothetical protein
LDEKHAGVSQGDIRAINKPDRLVKYAKIIKCRPTSYRVRGKELAAPITPRSLLVQFSTDHSGTLVAR